MTLEESKLCPECNKIYNSKTNRKCPTCGFDQGIFLSNMKPEIKKEIQKGKENG